MNLLLADSQSLSRLGLRTLLAQVPGVDSVTEAEDQDSMLEALASEQVDVVLIDFTSQGFGIDSVVEISRNHPHVGTLAITPDQNARTLASAVQAGVRSYVKKSCSLEEIINAVSDTAKGERFFCGQVLDRLRRESVDLDSLIDNDFGCEPVVISERESEIIALIAEGMTNTQIAEKLFLSGHTVGTHRKNIMQKLGVNNTAALVMYAVKTGMVNPNRFLFSARSN